LFSYAQGRLADDPEIASYRPRYAAPVFATKEVVLPPTKEAKTYVSPKLDVSAKLNRMLDSVYQNCRNIKYAEGYRVLVFSGTDRVAMNEVKQKVYKLYPNMEMYTVFKQPEYRVTFGDFIDKIQAYDYWLKISAMVPGALIVQDQINIR
jgi:hypothetical protein